MSRAQARRIRDLEARVQQLTEERAAAVREAAAHLAAAKRIAAQGMAAADPLVTALRRDLGRANALIAAQQKQLDHALGMDTVHVDAGADWQTRRTDKPHPAVKP
jgi:outer membrane protein OmpA-like peptidoglycan-associated protein